MVLPHDENEVSCNQSEEHDNSSEESDRVGFILTRKADFAPNIYTEEDSNNNVEENYLPVDPGSCTIKSAFWEHLLASPIPVDRTHFRVAGDITRFFTYQSSAVSRTCCSSNLTDDELINLFEFQERFRSVYSEELNPELWSITAKLRVCFDSAQQSANLVLYKQFLGLFSARTSVIHTSPSYDSRMIYQEAAVIHILSQAIEHAAKRYEISSYLHKRTEETVNSQETLSCNGFTRTHTLVLLPTKHMAWRFVMMLSAAGAKIFRLNTHRLQEWEQKFGCDEDEQRIDCPVQDGNRTAMLSLLADEVPEVLSSEITKQRKRNTARWHRLFCGDTDDSFSFGVQVYGNKIVLLTPLRVADIIVASPLGLRQQCNIDPTTDNTFRSRAGDGFKIINFVGSLSSLHTLFIYGIDSLEMQNWEHFLSCIWAINKTPREGSFVQTRNYACDIRTYLPAYLQDRQKLLLQVLVVGECFSEAFHKLISQQNLNTSEDQKIIDEPALRRSGPVQSIPMNEAFANCSLVHNSKGVIRISSIPSVYPHVMLRKHIPDLRIILYRLEKGAIQGRQTNCIDEQRLKFSVKSFSKLDYFINVLIPKLIKAPEIDKHILVVVPDYYMMIRIVRVLKLLSYSSVKWDFIEESATPKEITQSRRRLENGVFNFLIITERILHYREPPFSKLKTVIFLAPPMSPELLLNTKGYFSHLQDIYKSLIIVYTKATDLTRLGNCFPPNICLESTTKKITMFLNE